jgi:Sulfotransferase family
MIWMEARRLLFVHNPKCAGTAIHKALTAQFPDANAVWGRRYDASRDEIRDLAHMRIGEARSAFAIEGVFSSFGFVRDPYARFLSSFVHLKHWNKDFTALSQEELAFDLLDEERIRFDWKFVHFAPQYRFFYEGTARAVSHLWKVEDLPAAWDEVRAKFDFSAPLTVENKLDAPAPALSEAVIGRLNLLYARDFALFGYATRPGGTREARTLYRKFAALWPERRGLDMSDKMDI